MATIDDDEDGTEVSVTFAIRGDALVPASISTILGLEPSWSHAKGERYQSRAGVELARSSGVWSYSSEGKVDTREAESHAEFILRALSPKKRAITRYLEDPLFRVSIGIWWRPDGGSGGYTMTSESLSRLAEYCNELDFYFVGGD